MFSTLLTVVMVYGIAGDTEENVLKLCQHAGLSDDDRITIKNLQKLGVPIILEVCPLHSFVFFLMISHFCYCHIIVHYLSY